MDFLHQLSLIIENYRILGYFVVLFISILESLAFVGIVVPGTVFIILVGVVASKGLLDLGDVILFAASGAIIGDVCSYYLGRHANKFLSEDSKIFQSMYFKKAQSFFQKYGGASIFSGRFIGPIRPVIPFVAGMCRMETSKFIFWNVISGFAWATTFLFLGFFFGQALYAIKLWTGRGIMLLIIAVAFVATFYFIKRYFFKKVI